jgi:2-keto-3-deoxy-L-rhamnonate aldolase RhmA
MKASVGTWIQIPSPDICEILSTYNLDFVTFDMEHTHMSYESLPDMFRAFKGTNIKPYVRVRSNDTIEIRRALDIGAAGVIVPLVHTPEEAAKAVESAKYPPEGKRGFAFCRANNWGKDFSRYARKANSDTKVFVMAESRMAVENIDDIAKIEGLDGVFIGPYDMSASYGLLGQTKHSTLEGAFNRILDACRRNEIIAGKHVVSIDNQYIESDIKKGFRMIAAGIDALFIHEGAKAIEDISR